MMIFASIFGVGFLVLLINMLFGGGDDVEADFSGDADVDASGPNILSIRMASLLMVGFGAIGFGVRATTEVIKINKTTLSLLD